VSLGFDWRTPYWVCSNIFNEIKYFTLKTRTLLKVSCASRTSDALEPHKASSRVVTTPWLQYQESAIILLFGKCHWFATCYVSVECGQNGLTLTTFQPEVCLPSLGQVHSPTPPASSLACRLLNCGQTARACVRAPALNGFVNVDGFTSPSRAITHKEQWAWEVRFSLPVRTRQQWLRVINTILSVSTMDPPSDTITTNPFLQRCLDVCIINNNLEGH
jgi:hypothetical protein